MRREGIGTSGLRLIAGVFLAVIVTVPCPGSARLYLVDGKVLEGSEVWREGDDYAIRTSDGGVVTIPAGLVARVGLSTDERPQVAPDGPGQESGDEEQLPSNLTRATPRTLAGNPATLPTEASQTAVLGAPAKFQSGVVDPYWHPQNALDKNPSDPDRNNFAPAEWQKGVVDPYWHPESALDQNPSDPHRNEFAPSEFQKSIIDNTWVPQDGFAK